MLILIAGLILFLGLHSLRIFADDWRAAQIARMGKLPWRGFYSVVSLIGFALIVWGFGMARQAPVVIWSPPAWTHHLAALLVLVSFILVSAAYVPGNRFKSKIGHPMVAGVKIWALAHLLANGTLNDIVLFGSFLVWSIVLFAVSRRRDRAAGVAYPPLGVGRTVVTVIIGALAWAFFVHFGHRWFIGVSPFA